MTNSISLQQTQRLTLTPQLQQAIEILQIPSAELLDEIQRQTEENPLIEALPQEAPEREEFPPARDARIPEADPLEGTPSEDETDRADSPRSELDFGVSWGNPEPDDDSSPIDRAADAETLAEHLARQINVLRCPEELRRRILYLAGDLDEDGLLETPLEETAAQFRKEAGIERDPEGVWDEALRLLQRLDPAGIGVWSQQESLALQASILAERAEDASALRIRRLAESALRTALEPLAKKDFPRLRRMLGCSQQELKAVYEFIQTLNPRPASDFKTGAVPFAIPDLIVRKTDGGWSASLNPATAPKLRLSPELSELFRTGVPPGSEWSGRLSQAKNFIRSVEQRYETILRVAQAIVARQQAFFSFGPQKLEAMVLRDVASDTGLHESTVSRTVNGKYLQSPQGVFELKSFFSSRVASDSGDASSRAVRTLIRELIGAEPGTKPLSDAKLSALLEERGYHVARRTVAKYREQENIPAASLRKKI